jgi:hypothetical protein
MTTQEIVAKLWNLCNVLRDDGITYQDYVTELTYILFLKMLQETDREKVIAQGVKLAEGDDLTPEQENANKEKQVILDYSWDTLAHKDGLDLFNYYKTLVRVFGDYCTGRVREIYAGRSLWPARSPPSRAAHRMTPPALVSTRLASPYNHVAGGMCMPCHAIGGDYGHVAFGNNRISDP